MRTHPIIQGTLFAALLALPGTASASRPNPDHDILVDGGGGGTQCLYSPGPGYTCHVFKGDTVKGTFYDGLSNRNIVYWNYSGSYWVNPFKKDVVTDYSDGNMGDGNSRYLVADATTGVKVQYIISQHGCIENGANGVCLQWAWTTWLQIFCPTQNKWVGAHITATVRWDNLTVVPAQSGNVTPCVG